jgi:mannose-6-phosphate isomerase-like protein (cupin superfamily)
MGSAPAGLVRRQITLAPGSPLRGLAGPGGELWFVIAGTGRLDVGTPHGAVGADTLRGAADAGTLRGAAVAAGTGCRIPPGTEYRLRSEEQILLDAVSLPALPGPTASLPATATARAGPGGTAGTATAEEPRLSELAGCEVERTGDRRFRVLLGPGRGCEAATQFVGEIPPGRAPEHRHPYDEVVLVLDGEGVAHAGGSDRALAVGTSVHLPRGLPHCLENTGQGTLVVLGVFYPGGSPAAKTPGTLEAAR